MTKEEAIKIAIEALEHMACELYEEEEYDDPEVQAFVKRQDDAAEILEDL